MSFLFLLLSSVMASEELPKGSVLKEDSYVFSLQEAEDLKLRIIELEEKEKKLDLYIQLSENYEEKINIQDLNIQKYKEYSENLEKINNNNQLIIDKYMKKDNLSQIKAASYFVLGFGTAFGSVYLATKLD